MSELRAPPCTGLPSSALHSSIHLSFRRLTPPSTDRHHNSPSSLCLDTLLRPPPRPNFLRFSGASLPFPKLFDLSRKRPHPSAHVICEPRPCRLDWGEGEEDKRGHFCGCAEDVLISRKQPEFLSYILPSGGHWFTRIGKVHLLEFPGNIYATKHIVNFMNVDVRSNRSFEELARAVETKVVQHLTNIYIDQDQGSSYLKIKRSILLPTIVPMYLLVRLICLPPENTSSSIAH